MSHLMFLLLAQSIRAALATQPTEKLRHQVLGSRPNLLHGNARLDCHIRLFSSVDLWQRQHLSPFRFASFWGSILRRIRKCSKDKYPFAYLPCDRLAPKCLLASRGAQSGSSFEIGNANPGTGTLLMILLSKQETVLCGECPSAAVA